MPATAAQWLAASAVFLASINIGGGFLVTRRMLDMFRRPGDPSEHHYLWGVPLLGFLGSYVSTVASANVPVLHQSAYLLASLCCIGALAGLSSQSTSRWGNAMGIMGVSIGLAATLGSLGLAPAVLAQA